MDLLSFPAVVPPVAPSSEGAGSSATADGGDFSRTLTEVQRKGEPAGEKPLVRRGKPATEGKTEEQLAAVDTALPASAPVAPAPLGPIAPSPPLAKVAEAAPAPGDGLVQPAPEGAAPLETPEAPPGPAAEPGAAADADIGKQGEPLAQSLAALPLAQPAGRQGASAPLEDEARAAHGAPLDADGVADANDGNATAQRETTPHAGLADASKAKAAVSNGPQSGVTAQTDSVAQAAQAVGGQAGGPASDGGFVAALDQARAATGVDTAASAPAHAAPHRVPAAQQIAQQIIRRAEGGGARFELRLDPPEFGRVAVRLDVGPDSKVSAVIAADNPAALADLVRSARDLERALQQAGFELGERGLTFDLSDHGTGHADRDAGAASESSHAQATPEDADAGSLVRISPWQGTRIDLFA